MTTKEKVKKLYLEDNKTPTEISRILNISRQCVYKHIRSLKDCEDKLRERKENVVKKEKEIIDMFYNQHKKITDIAKEKNVSISEVSRIIRKDKKYYDEKENRKKNKIKYVITEEDNYILKKEHEIASRILSRRKKISDMELLKVCNNAYKMSDDKRYMLYNDKIGLKPNDMPGKIKVWR